MRVHLHSRKEILSQCFLETHQYVLEQFVMREMRGNIKSRTLMIAPPNSFNDYVNGIPFSDDRGEKFNILLEESGFNTGDKGQFVVIGATAFGLKPNKASTIPILKFVWRVAAAKLFDRYVCIGDNAFKYIFGEGRKVSMQTISGSTRYLEELHEKPLFTFPPIGLLVAEINDEMGNRQQYLMHRAAEETERKVQNCMDAFKKFMKL